MSTGIASKVISKSCDRNRDLVKLPPLAPNLVKGVLIIMELPTDIHAVLAPFSCAAIIPMVGMVSFAQTGAATHDG